MNQGAHQRNTLRHTAGELSRIIVLKVFQTNQVEHVVYPMLVALELVLHLQAEADIFFHRQATGTGSGAGTPCRGPGLGR